jgi:ubiquinol-cytochrome c reductase cytochrome b subunit
MAFASVEHIMRNVNGGWAIRYIHQNGASLFFIAVYMHIFRGLYYGSYKAPREITWIIGMLIYVLMMGTAFMGYVLPWGQMSFWGATVITGLFGAIPFVGDAIQTWLLGGPAVDNATLNRFLSLHYLLPFVILGMVILHIWAFHTTGNNNPTGVEVRRTSKKEAEADTLPFWPYFVIKDLFALAVILGLLRDRGLHAELPRPPRQLHRGQPAGDARAHRARMVLPAVLRDPAGLRRGRLGRDPRSFLTGGIIDAKFFGVLAMFGAIVVMALAPWLDTSSVRSGRYRPMFKWWFWLFVVNFFVLMWAGAMPAEGIYPYIALIGSAYWFAYFLVILPLLGVIEKPLPQPATIEEDFNEHYGKSDSGGRRLRTLRIAGRVTEKDDMSMFRKLAITAVTAARSPSPRGRRSPPGARARRGLQLLLRRALRPVRPEPAAARPAGLYRGLLGLPRPALRAAAHALGRRRPRPDRGRGARLYRDELHRGLRRVHPGLARGHAERPFPGIVAGKRARPQPDDQGARGLPRPLRPGLNQLFRGIGGPEYVASLLTHYTGSEREEFGAILYGNETFPGGYIAMAPPLWEDAVVYNDGTPPRSSRWRRTSPPS